MSEESDIGLPVVDQEGYLRINDLEFYIPPTAIQTAEHGINHKFVALRRPESIAIKSGHSILQFTITLMFGEVKFHPTGPKSKTESYLQLAQLTHQVSLCPFVSIENEMLRRMTSMSIGQQMAGVVQGITLQNGASYNMPEAIIATLQIQLFNYFPYSANFMYTSYFDPDEIQNLKDAYKSDVISFEEKQKPYSIGALLNKAARDPRMRPGLGNDPLKITQDMLSWEITPFEFYMYGGKNGEKFKNRVIEDLSDDITIEYYDWKAPVSAPPPDPNLDNSKISGQTGIAQYLVAMPAYAGCGFGYDGCEIKKLHQDVVGKFQAAFSRWSMNHSEKPIIITSSTRSLKNQLKISKSSPKGVASNPTKSLGAHLNGVAIDIRLMDSEQYGHHGDGLNEAEWKEWRAICTQFGIGPLSKTYGEKESWHFEIGGWQQMVGTSGISTKGVPESVIESDSVGGVYAPTGWTVDGDSLVKMIAEAKKYQLTEVLNLIGSAIGTPAPGCQSLDYFSDLSQGTEQTTNGKSGLMQITGKAAQQILQAYNIAYQSYLDRERKRLGDEKWEEVETAHGPLFRLKKTFTVSADSKELIPIAISTSISHTIPSIPLLGWSYPTHQYLGPTPTQGSITFEAVDVTGSELMEQLVGIFHGQQAAATAYRTVTRFNPLTIKNPILKLSGLEQVILEDVAASTLEGKPEARRLTITFTECTANPDEEQINLAYFKNDLHIQRQILEFMIDMGQIKAIVGQEEVTKIPVSSPGIVQTSKIMEVSVGKPITFTYQENADSMLTQIFKQFISVLNKQKATTEWISSDKWGIYNKIHVWETPIGPYGLPLEDFGTLASYILNNKKEVSHV